MNSVTPLTMVRVEYPMGIESSLYKTSSLMDRLIKGYAEYGKDFEPDSVANELASTMSKQPAAVDLVVYSSSEGVCVCVCVCV